MITGEQFKVLSDAQIDELYEQFVADALRRISGSKDFKTGQQKASQIHALCAQDLVDITTAAMKIHGKRFERFAQAAAAHVAILRDVRGGHTRKKRSLDPRASSNPTRPRAP